jgi:undecaprenyl-diphosphatase
MPSRRLRTLAAVAAACGISLAALSLLIRQGIPLPGDQEILQFAMSLRSEPLTEVIAVLTFISSALPALVLIIGLSAVEARRALLRARGRPAPVRLAWLILAGWPAWAYLAAVACNIAMRIAIGRLPPRVEYIPHTYPELRADFQRFAFPSGHAGASLVLCLALVAVAWRWPAARWIAAACALIVVLGAGFGRPYLGVHWPSDVLGGYLLAGFWLALALAVRSALAARLAAGVS